MTNAQVFSAFAKGAHCVGNSVRSEVLPNGTVVLYSYATPIAFRSPEGDYFFTQRKFSVTTSKQQSQAKGAVRNFTTMDDDLFRKLATEDGVSFAGAR